MRISSLLMPKKQGMPFHFPGQMRVSTGMSRPWLPTMGRSHMPRSPRIMAS